MNKRKISLAELKVLSERFPNMTVLDFLKKF